MAAKRGNSISDTSVLIFLEILFMRIATLNKKIVVINAPIFG
jgi:hypothetical protein